MKRTRIREIGLMQQVVRRLSTIAGHRTRSYGRSLVAAYIVVAAARSPSSIWQVCPTGQPCQDLYPTLAKEGPSTPQLHARCTVQDLESGLLALVDVSIVAPKRFQGPPKGEAGEIHT